MLGLFYKLNDGISLLQEAVTTLSWQQTLQVIAGDRNTSPVIGGYSTRLLNDSQLLTADQLMQYFGYAMSAAAAPVACDIHLLNAAPSQCNTLIEKMPE